jgi:uncharacterized protein (TIGR03083 family)
MSGTDPWPLIHAERAALIDDLAELDAERWTSPSLCGEWSVHEVFGHMTATARMTPPKFFAQMAKSGFRFHTMTANAAAREASATPSQSLTAFRAVLSATDHPPGPMDTWIGEALVHSEDIRRPLGIRREYPLETVLRAADFYKRSNALIGARNRIAGLSLRATDVDWTTGSGPEVRGPAMSLVMAMTGRSAALADLSGDGLDTLRSRMPNA